MEAEGAPGVQTTCLETPCWAASVSHPCVVTVAEETQICKMLSEVLTGVLCLHISETDSSLSSHYNTKFETMFRNLFVATASVNPVRLIVRKILYKYL